MLTIMLDSALLIPNAMVHHAIVHLCSLIQNYGVTKAKQTHHLADGTIIARVHTEGGWPWDPPPPEFWDLNENE